MGEPSEPGEGMPTISFFGQWGQTKEAKCGVVVEKNKFTHRKKRLDCLTRIKHTQVFNI